MSVKGCVIIICRNSRLRGLKSKIDYEHVAVGCLIYSVFKGDSWGSSEVCSDGNTQFTRCRPTLFAPQITLYSNDPFPL